LSGKAHSGTLPLLQQALRKEKGPPERVRIMIPGRGGKIPAKKKLMDQGLSPRMNDEILKTD
jgi:hypothetical protein